MRRCAFILELCMAHLPRKIDSISDRGIFADMRRRAKLQTNAAESIINRLFFQGCKGLLCLCALYIVCRASLLQVHTAVRQTII